MIFTRLSIAVLLLAGIVLAQTAPLQNKGARRQQAAGQQGTPFQALQDYLKLSPQQIDDLKAVQASMREELRPLFQQLAAKARALREELRKDPVDSTAVSNLRKEVETIQSNIKAKREEFASKNRNVLTSDQVKALAALEQALSLQRAAHQAAGLNLIDAPEGKRGFERGMGGFRPGMMGRRSGGR
jgi:Spy/CpxP family protein refolding chaperone